MSYEWIGPFSKDGFEFLGAYVCCSAGGSNFMLSANGTSLMVDDELLDSLRRRETSPELDFKLAQRYFAKAKGKPFPVFGLEPNVTFFLIDMTQRCNMDCCYCLRNTSVHESIDDGTLSDVCRFIIDYCERKGIKGISVQPWGGEPLLELDRILAAKKMFDESSVSCVFTVETNATLVTDEVARTLWENGIRVGVSVDGPKGINDIQRTFADGRGTYDAIKEGISNLKRYYGDGITGISVVTRHSIGKLDEMLDHAINVLGLKSLKFNIVRDNPFARERGLAPSPEQSAKFNVDLFHALVRMNKEGRVFVDPNIDAKICNLVSASQKSCCVSRGCQGGYRIVGFDRKGDIYPCDMTDVESVRIGSIYDGIPLDEQIARSAKRNRYFENKETKECEECPWRPFCRGGCSSRRLHCGYEGYDAVECAINKAVYPEYVRLIVEGGDAYRNLVTSPQNSSCLKYKYMRNRRSAYLAISDSCELRCITCPSPKRSSSTPSYLSLDDVSDYVSRNGLGHGDRVVLSGGEPTGNPDFIDIARLLTSKGITVTVLSNSLRFSDKGFAERFADSVDRSTASVIAAIHSADPTSHDEVTTVRGSHDKTMRGLSNLEDAGVDVQVKVLVTKRNF